MQQAIPGQAELRVDLNALIRLTKGFDCLTEERAVFTLPEGDVNIESKMGEILRKLQRSPGVKFQGLLPAIAVNGK